MKVCDAIMGSGKTMAAITEMNERTDTRFVFVTPYLDEVHRICVGCEGRRFVAPDADVCGTKLRHFKSLVRAGRNVACSHALFRDYDAEAVEDIASVYADSGRIDCGDGSVASREKGRLFNARIRVDTGR